MVSETTEISFTPLACSFLAVDEPLHLGHLLVFAQRGWLKLTVDPLLGLCLAGPGGVTQNQGRGGERNRLELHLHCCLLRWNPLGRTTPALGNQAYAWHTIKK